MPLYRGWAVVAACGVIATFSWGLGFYGLGSDAVPAAEARDLGYPGFAGLNLPGGSNSAWSEPYIYHFPDGNAAVTRMLVRSVVPAVAPGSTMEDVVEAPFDYARLDVEGQAVRVRLQSTCVHVAQARDKVRVAYVRDGALRRVEARHRPLQHVAEQVVEPAL